MAGENVRKRDAVPTPRVPRDFIVSVARRLLQFIAIEGRVPRNVAQPLSWQLNSAIAARFGVATVVDDMGTVLPDELRQVQQQVRDAITAVRRGEVFVRLAAARPIEAIEVGISRDVGSRALHAAWLLTDRRLAFWMGVAVALEQAGDLIHECARQDCRRLYVRLRGQKYCSPACSQRDRSARHYAAHRDEVLEQRHEAYVRARRQQQKRARIARRRHRR
jgi:hypothetical protein